MRQVVRAGATWRFFGANDPGTISAKLPDLMTYLTLGARYEFEDVNLARLIGRLRYHMRVEDDYRYGFFLRAMMDDKMSSDEITGTGADTVREVFLIQPKRPCGHHY